MIYGEGKDLSQLLIEDAVIVRKRENCEEMIKTLRKCLEYVNEARDFTFEEEKSIVFY